MDWKLRKNNEMPSDVEHDDAFVPETDSSRRNASPQPTFDENASGGFYIDMDALRSASPRDSQQNLDPERTRPVEAYGHDTSGRAASESPLVFLDETPRFDDDPAPFLDERRNGAASYPSADDNGSQFGAFAPYRGTSSTPPPFTPATPPPYEPPPISPRVDGGSAKGSQRPDTPLPHVGHGHDGGQPFGGSRHEGGDEHGGATRNTAPFGSQGSSYAGAPPRGSSAFQPIGPMAEPPSSERYEVEIAPEREAVASGLVSTTDTGIPRVAPFIMDVPGAYTNLNDVETDHFLLIKVRNLSASMPLTKEITSIGRPDSITQCYPDVEIELDDSVSRRHAEIRRRGDEFFVVDVGSTNGTLLNGQKLQAKLEVRLGHGDRIRVGDRTEIIFE